MAKEEHIEISGSSKITHKNIFAALSAFQGENPEIKKTKEFGKAGETMHWWYSPLDEVLQVVRPLLAKHGLSVTFEDKGESRMCCALYHETYEVTHESLQKSTELFSSDELREKNLDYTDKEKNVIRSMGIKVKREGDMKGIGSDSTYARRYTLGEVLGVAPDEDKDIGFDSGRGNQLEKVIFTKSKEGLMKATTTKAIQDSVAIFTKDMAMIEQKKVPSLGLSKENYQELLDLAAQRRIDIERMSNVGRGERGDNLDGGGTAEIDLDDKG